MLKLVGKIVVDSIPGTDLSRLPDPERDFKTEQVALDACISVASQYFIRINSADERLAEKFAALIREVKHQFCDPSYDEEYVCSIERDAGSILVFQNVTQHRDIDFAFYKRGAERQRYNKIPASTFSIVLAGSCTLNLHRKRGVESLDLVEGDIYVFEQSTIHSVTNASGTCVHITTSIPQSVARELKQIGVTKKAAAKPANELTRSRA